MALSKTTLWSINQRRSTNLIGNKNTNSSIHTFNMNVENPNPKGRTLENNLTWAEITIETL